MAPTCATGDRASTLLHEAGEALYQAKARGRNTVFIASQTHQPPTGYEK